ncbi:phage tail tape measure protein, lambda family [Collimonas sp. OK607]|uniref:phage tail tape measure C-terminal domain-containing protein n=1 Tax=Collimonas sp. OK607 TaxID=1798194 RepID=UPI0008F3A2DC|nr:phage tail tape measure C-terminal domain-containing protein [Collimonas sp. OK607]SFB02670.1 phage tail tape measure protein, lambda family [Collimonas sp. OK607]
MAALGSVVVELSANLAKFQSDMGKAAQIAEDRMKQIDKAVGLVKTGLGAIGLGFALGATVDKVKEKIEGAIASAAGLQQLSERTGAAVESLSGLAAVAKLSGTDMDSLAGGLQKLSKAIVDAQNGGAKTTAAFNAIGIAVDDLKGKGPDQVFKLIADRMATYQDGVEKTVIAQTLLGKAGANLLPVMTDLAKVGDLQVKVTKEQAEAADELEKNQLRLKASTDAIFKKIGLELVPVLNAFTKALLESQNANDGVRKSIDGLAKDGSIRDWAEGAAKVVGFVVDAFDGVSRAVQITGKTIGAAAAQAVLLGQGEIKAASQVGKELYKDIDDILQKQLFSTRLAKQLEDARKQNHETAPRGRIDTSKLGNANAGPKDDPAKKLLEGQLKAQEDIIAAEKTQLQTREQYLDFYRNLEYFSLREAEQKKQALLTDNLQVVQAAYDKEIAAIQAYVNQAEKEVERQDGRNKIAEAKKKRAAAEIEVNKQLGDSQNRLLAVQRQFDLATTERTRTDSIANEQALFQIDLMGRNTLEVEKLTAARKIQMDLEERIYRLKKLDPEADTSAAVAQAALQTAAATSIIELSYNRQRDAIFGASEAVRKYQEDATNSALHIENAMTRAFQGMEDALVTFVTTGKLSFKNLADSIVADITRIIIKQQIAAAIGGGGNGGGSGWLTNLAGMAAGALFGTSGTAAVASSMGGDALDNMMNLTNAFGTAPGRALGGPVSSGGLYEVNESGQPELLASGGKQYLMMGSQGGTVTPQAASAARGDTYVTVQVTPPAGSSRETAQQWGATAGRQLQHALRRNG